MSNTSKKWDDATVTVLRNAIGNESPVSAATVAALATTLEVSERSVSSKARQLGYEVASMAKEKVAKFSEVQTAELTAFVTSNAGKYTYKEIAAQFPGAFSAKQIQGKLLALELTASVKPTEKVEAARTYTAAEEEVFVTMAAKNAFIEDIAAALGKEIASVRGKALSLSRAGLIHSIPAQKESHAKNTVDAVAALGDAIKSMTVDEIAKAADKTDRGIRTLLTRRGITVADYDGQAKKAKAEAKTAKAVAPVVGAVA